MQEQDALSLVAEIARSLKEGKGKPTERVLRALGELGVAPRTGETPMQAINRAARERDEWKLVEREMQRTITNLRLCSLKHPPRDDSRVHTIYFRRVHETLTRVIKVIEGTSLYQREHECEKEHATSPAKSTEN